MRSKSKVCFFFQGQRFSLQNRSRLKGFIEKTLKAEGLNPGQLNYIFCSDREIKKINKTYLKHDYATDIITFDLSWQKEVTADIYISIDRVRENAKDLGVSIKNELHRVIFHGALHLCGYKDKKPAEIKIMRAKEEELLSKYGV